MSSEILDIVYDGQCGFCARSLAFCTRLARRSVFRLHDANDREMMEARFPMLADADTADAMFVVSGDGAVFRGFFAFRRMMRASPWLYPFLLVFYAPGASLLGPRLYSWIARHRRGFGCVAQACAVPPPPGRPRL